MNNKLLIKILPIFIVTSSLVLAGVFTYSIAPKPSHAETTTPVRVLGVAAPSPSPIFSPTPSPKIIILVSPKPTPLKSPVVPISPTPQPSPSAKVENTVPSSPQPTNTPSPSASVAPSPSPSPSLSPTPLVSQINVQIKTPDTNSAFSLQIEDGINACDLMTKAKNEGKISSLTLDDSYLATFHTLLVKEINGLKDNWTFTVNGESPMGCSLVNLKDKDQIIWEFIIWGGQ